MDRLYKLNLYKGVKKNWSEEELDILNKYYSKGGYSKVSEEIDRLYGTINKRSKKAINNKASKLGIKVIRKKV